jgi:hypothetical protein
MRRPRGRRAAREAEGAGARQEKEPSAAPPGARGASGGAAVAASSAPRPISGRIARRLERLAARRARADMAESASSDA